MGFGDFVSGLNPFGSEFLTKPFERTSQYGTVDPGGDLSDQSRASGFFANRAQKGFDQLGGEASAERDYLRRLASGKDSVSAEQLRQGLQQNVAGQMSMAATARPGSAPMAARSAMMNAGRAASAMSGQQAVAGLQERQMAHQGLSNMLMQQRQQELQAALQGRQNAMQGMGMLEQARTSRYATDMGTPTSAEALLGPLGSAMRAGGGGG